MPKRNPALMFLVLLIGSGAIAQDRTNPPKPAKIEGIVVNQKTGDPLVDVRVTATPEVVGGMAKSATTDVAGRFSLADLPPGRYTLNATRTLFFRPRRNSGAANLTLAADQTHRDVRILLAPTAVISGRVFDENREPLRSVQIQAVRWEYRDGARTLMNVGQATSDDRGEYRIFNLQPGSYYIRATRQQGAIYYPNAMEPQGGVAVQVESGGDRGGVNLSLLPVSTYPIRLQISGAPSGATLNATFSVSRKGAGAPLGINVQTESLGGNAYRLSRLMPGAYDIFVQLRPTATAAPSAAVNPLSGFTTINIVDTSEKEIDAGTIAVRGSIPISDRIVMPESPSGASNFRNIAIMLRPQDGLPTTFNATSRGTGGSITDEGVFVIPNVANGRFLLSVSGLPADAYLTSARYGSREILDTGLVVDGIQAGPLELVVTGPGSVGAVTGTVADAKQEPVADSMIALVPAAARRGNPNAFKTATTDQFGAFSIRNVLPGEYTVLAWEELEPGAYQNPEFLKDFDSRGEKVTVGKGMSSVVSVRVIPSAN